MMQTLLIISHYNFLLNVTTFDAKTSAQKGDYKIVLVFLQNLNLHLPKMDLFVQFLEFNSSFIF